LKKTVLELGGSDAYLVLDDADLDAAVDICVKSRLNNAGQSCIAAKRFIVHKAKRAQFEQAYAARFRNIRQGDPRDAQSDIGPLSRRIEAGSIFVNAFVKSDVRLPFGGVKNSGYGRELS
jgi:succinate-semialdehyde dehydrogenase/glutarate-semialdehyde dehydrogenase